jgi:chemotaxis protein MotA
MIVILAGLLVVFGSVLAGFMIEEGHPLVLAQPAELLIIIGAGAGTVLVANPRRSLRNVAEALGSLRRPPPISRQFYLELLKLLYVAFAVSQRNGVAELERHMEDPRQSEIFSENPILANDPETLAFLCDSFRIATAAGLDAGEVERLLALDLEVQRSGRNQPVNVLMRPAWVLSPRSSESWLRCRRSEARRPKSATRLPPLWSARSSAYFCVTGWWLPLPRTCSKSTGRARRCCM